MRQASATLRSVISTHDSGARRYEDELERSQDPALRRDLATAIALTKALAAAPLPKDAVQRMSLSVAGDCVAPGGLHASSTTSGSEHDGTAASDALKSGTFWAINERTATRSWAGVASEAANARSAAGGHGSLAGTQHRNGRAGLHSGGGGKREKLGKRAQEYVQHDEPQGSRLSNEGS